MPMLTKPKKVRGWAPFGCAVGIWVWVNTYRYSFSGMNIHLPAILGFTRYQGFDPSPYVWGVRLSRGKVEDQDHRVKVPGLVGQWKLKLTAPWLMVWGFGVQTRDIISPQNVTVFMDIFKFWGSQVSNTAI